LGYISGAPQAAQNRLAAFAFAPHRPQNFIPCGGGAGLWGGIGLAAGGGADVSIAGMGVSTRGASMNLLSKIDTSPGRLNMSFTFFGLCCAPQWGQIFSPAVYQWHVSQNMGASFDLWTSGLQLT